jgi:hypothetical protein
VDSTDDEYENAPRRGLLGLLGVSDSVINNTSLYSFIQERPKEDPKGNEEESFGRGGKKQALNKMSFVGTGDANKPAKRSFLGIECKQYVR